MTRCFYLILLLWLSSIGSFAQYSKRDLKMAIDTYNTIKTTKGFYDDRYLLAFIDHIGRSLEVKMDEHYHFEYFLVDDPTPNAFATTGGFVYVNRGLFLHINTPDDLAGVLAHELIHVTQHHVSNRITAGILPNILQLPGNLLGLLTYKEVAQVINAPIKAASGLVTNSFNRTQEKEADLQGITLAHRAGYDPYALGRVLKRMEAHQSQKGHKAAIKTLFQDHPMTENRISDMHAHLKEMGIKPKEKIPGTTLSILDGLPIDQNPKAGIFNGAQFVHPDLGFACDLPEGWSVQNSPISITAISPDKKSTLIISVDWGITSPYSAANIDMLELKKSEVLDARPDSTNGLLAYRATTRDRRVKYADLVSEFLWIKIPTSQVVIKVVGISNYNDPDPNILDSFLTFRAISEYEKRDLSYPILRLGQPTDQETLKEYAQRNDLDWQMKILQNLNDVQSEEVVPQERFIKTIEFATVR